jgi:hypothetical protein
MVVDFPLFRDSTYPANENPSFHSGETILIKIFIRIAILYEYPQIDF